MKNETTDNTDEAQIHVDVRYIDMSNTCILQFARDTGNELLIFLFFIIQSLH